MINKKEFIKMRNELEAYDKERETLINQSRVVLKQAKQLIYSVQRANIREANTLLKNLLQEKSKLDKITKSKLKKEGSYSEACQEYVEAITFLEFEKGNKLPTASQLKVSTKDYLMGLADLTGELVRLGIAYAIKGEYFKTEKIKEFVSIIWGELLKFDFRNSALRRKFDSIKYNLIKLEKIIYDIKIKGK